MSRRFPHLAAQLYFLALAAINTLHGLLPFRLRPLLYRLCRFDIAPSATLQGGIRFFHVGRLSVGEGSLVNRGVYLDNRGGITIGRQVSIAHDARVPVPAWLTAQFQPTELTLTVDGQTMKVFQHRAKVDESLTFGSNAENATQLPTANMYIVFVNAEPEKK